MDVAKSISEGLARNVLSAKVNGEVRDANRPLPGDCTLSLLTWNDDEGKATLWHSSAHLLAEAIEALYPGTKFGIGPAIDLEDVRSNGYAFQIEMSFRAMRKGFKPVEIPIVFADRTEGESKMSGHIVREAIFMVWRLRWWALTGRV